WRCRVGCRSQAAGLQRDANPPPTPPERRPREVALPARTRGRGVAAAAGSGGRGGRAAPAGAEVDPETRRRQGLPRARGPPRGGEGALRWTRPQAGEGALGWTRPQAGEGALGWTRPQAGDRALGGTRPQARRYGSATKRD